ncbi:hypothetical protein NQ318_009257 [Aromia moschata]|uniref:non-specific serine/threonine protein kinase n=1 Tax=Aromia moschata TaxID=1265417 RepID=A0AAV8YCC2_9CUCU|nr:hypothetical protein NQ318_009257 [Aromia moschata]
MGNQLVGIAPSQIFPVERYLTDHPELKFDTSLGSTRFLKVARAESQEGLVVVKVFAIHDPSLPLTTYRDHLEDVRKKLSSAVNCIPYQKIILNEKAGLIMREYVKYSLYDRISTRPFLTNIEKRWITFQILYALHQCHKVGVCHGDIKLENITVTSWNWVLLVDFASFKPTFLPIDNPADYSYFFDTSRRRTCYIAPERFSSTSTISTESSALIAETSCDSGGSNPCDGYFFCWLWNELHVPFEYSQLLAYRNGKYSPQKHLDKLEDSNLRELISNRSIQKVVGGGLPSPAPRHLIPQYFFSFLQSYMLIFSASPILSPDEKIMRLKKDIANIFKFLGPMTKSSSEKEEEKQDMEKDKGECEGLVIITSLVTACIRGLHDCSSKLFSLEILLELATHASDETILDRILPYIISAINTITKCLDLVAKIPRSDANIFPEYILPELAPLATDPNTCVRTAYAKNVATLAEIALRYLEQIQNDWYDNNNSSKQKDIHSFNYELELQALHEMISQTVSALLTDTQSIVKQTLMDSGITKLCVFFGKTKANDVLLSHMITFLNDKEDRELRGSFFDCIVGVAAYIGWHCSGNTHPGLTDCSEFVTMKSINAMAALTELGLLSKPALCELVMECSYFLVHPSLWVRQAVAGVHLDGGQNADRMMPHLGTYMKYSLIQIDKPELLLDSLVSPIPRNIYDSVVAFSDIDILLDVLRERKSVRDCLNMGKVPTTEFYRESNANLKNLFRRLEANGMNESMEEYFLKMGHHLKKIHKHKTSADARHNKQSEGKIDLNSTVGRHIFNLAEVAEAGIPVQQFGCADEAVGEHELGGPPSRSTSSRPSSPPPDGHNQFISTDPSSNLSLHERSYIQYRRSNCYVELSNLRNRQQEHYFEALRNREWAEQAAWRPKLPPPGWHLKGVLVAHLHEHRSAINKLCTFTDTPMFASCSADGSVVGLFQNGRGRISPTDRNSTIRWGRGACVTGMAVCEGGQSLGATCQDGTVNILRVDSASNKMSLVQSRDLDPDEDGYAVEVHCLDSGSQSVLVYATLYGSVVGWDLRAPGEAWRLENDLKHGLITTFCVDNTHQSWLTLGTSSGFHTVWDLRFQLPITTVEHMAARTIPGGVRIKKVICHPTEHSWIMSSIQGNNEISMWNLETSFRQKVLWSSTAPPLSKTQSSGNSVCAMLAGCIDRSPFLVAGGTDQRLRFWDLESPSESYLAVPAASDPSGTSLNYRSRLIDGTQVTYEEATNVRKVDRGEEVPRAGPEPPAGGPQGLHLRHCAVQGLPVLYGVVFEGRRH